LGKHFTVEINLDSGDNELSVALGKKNLRGVGRIEPIKRSSDLS